MRRKFLVGAPEPSSSFKEEDSTNNNLLPAFLRFLDVQPASNTASCLQSFPRSSSNICPAWRCLPTGCSHGGAKRKYPSNTVYDIDELTTSFLTTASLSPPPSTPDIEWASSQARPAQTESLSQLHSQSFILHEELLSANSSTLTVSTNATISPSPSNPAPQRQPFSRQIPLPLTSSSSTTTITTTTTATKLKPTNSIPPILTLQATTPTPKITPLAALLKSHNHNQPLQTQQPTYTLLVAFLSRQPPLHLHLRRSGHPIDLINLHVADDTLPAGLRVACWVPPAPTVPPAPAPASAAAAPSKPPTPHPDLRTALTALRVGDVILLRRVALAAFRGTVYVQSVGSGKGAGSGAGQGTGVVVLWRRGASAGTVTAGGNGDLERGEGALEKSAGLDLDLDLERGEGGFGERGRAVGAWARRFVVPDFGGTEWRRKRKRRRVGDGEEDEDEDEDDGDGDVEMLPEDTQ